MDFEYLKTNENIIIKGPLLITPKRFDDSRGFFYESWNKETLDKVTNTKINFVQYCDRGVRGKRLHRQHQRHLESEAQQKPFDRGRKIERHQSSHIGYAGLDHHN